MNKTMKTTIITILGSISLTGAASAQTVYQFSSADYSQVGANGGNYSLTYNLTSGVDFGLGNSITVNGSFGAWDNPAFTWNYVNPEQIHTNSAVLGSAVSASTLDAAPAGINGYVLTEAKAATATFSVTNIQGGGTDYTTAYIGPVRNTVDFMSAAAFNLTADYSQTVNGIGIAAGTAHNLTGSPYMYPASVVIDDGSPKGTAVPATITYSPVPEPSSTALLGFGVLGMLTRRKR